MTSPFSVRTTPRFDRLLRKLVRHHPELTNRYADAINLLKTDPHNVSRTHDIIKLENVRPGDGQYRLRIGRWRFRYDIYGREVVLQYCGLRREETYR